MTAYRGWSLEDRCVPKLELGNELKGEIEQPLFLMSAWRWALYASMRLSLKILVCFWVILVSAVPSAWGEAAFGGEIQRFRVLEASPTTVINLTGTIPSGSVGILDIAVEAPASMKVASAADSKGNAWTPRACVVNNTVHQAHILTGVIQTALLPGDTITVSFDGAKNSARFGSLQFLTGCFGDKPELVIETRSYGTLVKARVDTPFPGMIIAGFLQIDFRSEPVYTAQTWKQIGDSDHFGQSAGTVGLLNSYLYRIAADAGKNDLDGSYNSKQSWSFVAVGFRPREGAGNRPPDPRK